MRQPNSDVYARSGPHRKVERILDGIGLPYESEYPFPPYTADIYLASWHISIEIDGPHHVKKKDEKRDTNLLEKYGLHVLHLPLKNGLNKEYVTSAVLNFIDLHYEDSEIRKKTWLTQVLRD